MTMHLPKYPELVEVLTGLSMNLYPAEIHGLICGVLMKNDSEKWREFITGKDHAALPPLIEQLYQASKKQLTDFLFEFELVLPEDHFPLPDRAQALSLWCQGFLMGLQSINITVSSSNEGDVGEAIGDIIEIAKMNYEDVVATNEDEAAYTELVEYVRMAVILIYQAFHQDNKRSTAQVH